MCLTIVWLIAYILLLNLPTPCPFITTTSSTPHPKVEEEKKKKKKKNTPMIRTMEDFQPEQMKAPLS